MITDILRDEKAVFIIVSNFLHFNPYKFSKRILLTGRKSK